VENQLHTTSIRQSTYQDLGQKFGLRRILFISLTCGAFCTIKKSFLRLILSVKILYLITLWCIWLRVFCSVYQFTCSKNDSNSNIQWSQRHNLYKTVMKKVSNHKPFVTPNLARYKSHNTISIPQQFIRNNIRVLSVYKKPIAVKHVFVSEVATAQRFSLCKCPDGAQTWILVFSTFWY